MASARWSVSADGKILVTGAGGFIGGWLAECLFLDDPGCVRAGIHRWSSGVRPARFPMELVLCDILDPDQVSGAVRGVSRIIHCAKGATRESILLGTRILLEAALKEGVRHFFYLSTTEIYRGIEGTIDENVIPRKSGQLYGDAKIDAEQACREYAAKGLPVTILRPPIVYGPFSKTWTVGIAQKLVSGNWGIFKGQAEGICNLIYISDLVAGILALMNSGCAAGDVFILNGPEAVTWNEYFERFNTALDLPPLKVIEPGRARLQAHLLEPVRNGARAARDRYGRQIKEAASLFPPAKERLKALENTLKTAPRLADFDLFNRRALFCANKAEEVSGFKPRIDLDAGLGLSAAWLRQVGLVEAG
jgi:nucleoside-diphosphate-sugar epimerase